MSGTKEGGLKAKITNLRIHGDNFYAEIGGKGGRACVEKGFSMNPALAREAGRKGGKKSKRGKAKKRED